MNDPVELSPPVPGGFWWWAPWLIGVAGLAASIALGWGMHQGERQRVQDRFNLEAEERIKLLRTQFVASIRELELVASLLQSDPRDSYWEDSLKGQLRESGFWDSIAWARMLTAEERDAWQQRMRRRTSDMGFSIRSWDGAAWRKAREDLQYLPVQFLYLKEAASADGPALELGWDLMSRQEWWDLLFEAQELRRPTLNMERQVAPESADRKSHSFQVLVPPRDAVTGDSGFPESTRGYLIATANFDALFAAAMVIADARGASRTLLMQFVRDDNTTFYTHPATLSENPSTPPYQDELRVAGQRWRVLCSPTKTYFQQNRTWTPILWFVSSILMTAIIAGGSSLLIGRAARIERLVASRTSELQTANARLRKAVNRHEQAKEALRESTAAYESLVESLPLNVFRKDREGRIVSANRRFSETLGRPMEEILNKTDEDFFPSESAQKYRQDDLHVMNSGEALEDVETHVRPDGQLLHVRVMKAPARDANNRIVGVQGMFWDVSARIRAEREQRLTDARLRRLVESDLIAVAFTDLDDQILDANDAYLQLAGYDRRDMQRTAGDLSPCPPTRDSTEPRA